MFETRKILIVAFLLLLNSVVNCNCDSSSSDEDENPNASLEHNCFNWPEEDFSPDNFVQDLTPGVSEGENAPDFSLMDVDDNEYTLSELLETKPVLLVFGSYT